MIQSCRLYAVDVVSKMVASRGVESAFNLSAYHDDTSHHQREPGMGSRPDGGSIATEVLSPQKHLSCADTVIARSSLRRNPLTWSSKRRRWSPAPQKSLAASVVVGFAIANEFN
jgi:hypothetical protein